MLDPISLSTLLNGMQGWVSAKAKSIFGTVEKMVKTNKNCRTTNIQKCQEHQNWFILFSLTLFFDCGKNESTKAFSAILV